MGAAVRPTQKLPAGQLVASDEPASQYCPGRAVHGVAAASAGGVWVVVVVVVGRVVVVVVVVVGRVVPVGGVPVVGRVVPVGGRVPV